MIRNSSVTPRKPLETGKAKGKMEKVVRCTPASPLVNASPVSPAGIHGIIGGDDATINGLTPSTPLHDIVVHKNITNTNNNSHDQDCGTRSGSGSSIAGQSLDAPSSGKTKESLEGAGESITIVLGAASIDGLSSVAATHQATPVITRASTSIHSTERTASSADESKDGSGNTSHNSSAVHHLPMDAPKTGDHSKEGRTQPIPEITPYLTAAILSGVAMSTTDADPPNLTEIDSIPVASSVAGLGPLTTHIEVYAPETRTMYHSIPLAFVSHKGHSDSPKFYVCQSHSMGVRNPVQKKTCAFSTLANEKANQSEFGSIPSCDVTGTRACAMGNQCRFVHIDVPLTQLKGDVIHVHYVYRNEDCCSYESLSKAMGLDKEEASTMHLSVLGPRCQEPVEKIQVCHILKTEGSVKAYSQLCQKIKRSRSVPNQKVRSEQLAEVSDKGRPEGKGALAPTDTLACHCQHYYFNQICNRGASCAFIHVISVDKSQERDSIRPPTYKKRIQTTGDLRRDQQTLESTPQVHPRLPSTTSKPSTTDADLKKRDVQQSSNVIRRDQLDAEDAANLKPSHDASSVKDTIGDLANLRDNRRKRQQQLDVQASTAAESFTKQRLRTNPEIRGASRRGTAAAQKFVTPSPTSFVTVRVGTGQQSPAAVGKPSRLSPATISIGGVTLKAMPISSACTDSAAFEESRECEDGVEVMSTASTMTARSIVGSSPWNVNFPRVGLDLSPRSSIAMRRMPHGSSPSTSPNQAWGNMRQGDAGGNNTFLMPEMGHELGGRQNSFSMAASGGGCDSPLLCEALGDLQMGGAHIMHGQGQGGADSRKRRRGAGACRDATQSNTSPNYVGHLSVRVGASPRSGPIHVNTEGNGVFFMGGGAHTTKGSPHSRAHIHERQNTSLNMGQSAIDMSQIDTAASSSPCSGMNTPAIARAPPGRYVHNPYGQRSGHCTPVTLTRGNTEILGSPLVSQHQLVANETCLPPSDCGPGGDENQGKGGERI